MKILWLTVCRDNRTSPYIFTGLRDEVKRLLGGGCQVIERKFDKPIGDICIEAFLNWKSNPCFIPPLFTAKQMNNYDIIFTDSIFTYMSEDWENVKAKKVVLMEDQHGGMVKWYMGRAFRRFKFDAVFTRYKNPVATHHPHLFDEKKVFWMPHSVVPYVYMDYKQEKNGLVLSTGRLVPKIYPLRNRIHRALKDQPWYQRVRRPSEKIIHKWPVGKDYAKLINKSSAAITCTSIYNYPVMKLFEIPACRTAMICDYIPEMKDLGFIPGKNFIHIELGRDYLKEISAVLERKDDLERIADEGYKLIRQRHTANIRAREFVKCLEKI